MMNPSVNYHTFTLCFIFHQLQMNETLVCPEDVEAMEHITRGFLVQQYQSPQLLAARVLTSAGLWDPNEPLWRCFRNP